MAKIDGGPAFPTHGGHHPDDDPRNHTLGGGMSMRDWFAGQALIGLLANPNHQVGTVTFERIGQDAYKFAYAMIAARDEEGTWR